jgi:hypothetical protein
MMEVSLRCYCREKLETLPVPCEHIILLMTFTANNLDNFQANSVVHRMNTKAKHQLHKPTVKLSCIQKGVFYSSIRNLIVYPLYCETKTEEMKI